MASKVAQLLKDTVLLSRPNVLCGTYDNQMLIKSIEALRPGDYHLIQSKSEKEIYDEYWGRSQTAEFKEFMDRFNKDSGEIHSGNSFLVTLSWLNSKLKGIDLSEVK